MKKVALYILSILFVSSSCDFKNGDTNLVESTPADSTKNKGICQSILMELSKFIDLHNDRLKNYSDSIFYVINFQRIDSNTTTLMEFHTSAMVPEIIDTISVLVGHCHIDSKQIIIIDDRGLPNKNIYNCISLTPFDDQFGIIKSDALYTEFAHKKFTVKNGEIFQE